MKEIPIIEYFSLSEEHLSVEDMLEQLLRKDRFQMITVMFSKYLQKLEIFAKAANLEIKRKRLFDKDINYTVINPLLTFFPYRITDQYVIEHINASNELYEVMMSVPVRTARAALIKFEANIVLQTYISFTLIAFARDHHNPSIEELCACILIFYHVINHDFTLDFEYFFKADLFEGYFEVLLGPYNSHSKLSAQYRRLTELMVLHDYYLPKAYENDLSYYSAISSIFDPDKREIYFQKDIIGGLITEYNKEITEHAKSLTHPLDLQPELFDLMVEGVLKLDDENINTKVIHQKYRIMHQQNYWMHDRLSDVASEYRYFYVVESIEVDQNAIICSSNTILTLPEELFREIRLHGGGQKILITLPSLFVESLDIDTYDQLNAYRVNENNFIGVIRYLHSANIVYPLSFTMVPRLDYSSFKFYAGVLNDHGDMHQALPSLPAMHSAVQHSSIMAFHEIDLSHELEVPSLQNALFSTLEELEIDSLTHGNKLVCTLMVRDMSIHLFTFLWPRLNNLYRRDLNGFNTTSRMIVDILKQKLSKK